MSRCNFDSTKYFLPITVCWPLYFLLKNVCNLVQLVNISSQNESNIKGEKQLDKLNFSMTYFWRIPQLKHFFSYLKLKHWIWLVVGSRQPQHYTSSLNGCQQALFVSQSTIITTHACIRMRVNSFTVIV